MATTILITQVTVVMLTTTSSTVAMMAVTMILLRRLSTEIHGMQYFALASFGARYVECCLQRVAHGKH